MILEIPDAARNLQPLFNLMKKLKFGYKSDKDYGGTTAQLYLLRNWSGICQFSSFFFKTVAVN